MSIDLSLSRLVVVDVEGKDALHVGVVLAGVPENVDRRVVRPSGGFRVGEVRRGGISPRRRRHGWGQAGRPPERT